jgi:hypothetical protein
MDSHAAIRPGGTHCRFCEAPLELTMVDLGKSPLCESFLLVSRVTGCAVEMAEGSSADDRSYRADFSKLRTVFPELSLDWDAECGAHELADAYRAVGLTSAEFEGDRYVRLRRLESLLEAHELSSDLRRGGEGSPRCIRLDLSERLAPAPSGPT